MESATQVDVFVAGAGPVGLFLANECARRGMSFRIVETNPTQSMHSKALAIFPRTLEIFDMAGLSAPFVKAANRVTSIAFVAGQRRLGSIEFTPKETPYPYVAMVPQDVTEALLLEHLRSTGGEVEYETTLTAARETTSGVEVTVERGGAPETIEAKYLVGCDGAHSVVRHLLDLPFEGGDYAEQFLLADAVTNDVIPSDELQLCPNADGPFAIFPMSPTRRRLLAMVEEVEGDAPSLELVNEIAAQRGPEGFKAESLLWSSYFRIHHRCVAQMSAGRMFVAGDSAHIHSPFGGQGMNTGLQDAWNLVWKLDLAVSGCATDALLQSYTPERHPIVQGVIETTHFLTTTLGARNPLAEGIRDAVIPVVTHLPRFQHAFVERLSGLGNTYKGSAIVEGAGKRHFDESLRGGRGIKGRFILMVPGADAETTTAAEQLAARSPKTVELRPYGGRSLLLVRPDGYVAAEAAAGDSNAIAQIAEVLDRQVFTAG